MRVPIWHWLTAITVTTALASAAWLTQSDGDAPLVRSAVLHGTELHLLPLMPTAAGPAAASGSSSRPH